MSKEPIQWAVIYQCYNSTEIYHCHNCQQDIARLEGLGMTHVWVTPNTPKDVLDILAIRVAPRSGTITILKP